MLLCKLVEMASFYKCHNSLVYSELLYIALWVKSDVYINPCSYSYNYRYYLCVSQVVEILTHGVIFFNRRISVLLSLGT